eukprot:2856882-Amphidinium_carterae.2
MQALCDSLTCNGGIPGEIRRLHIVCAKGKLLRSCACFSPLRQGWRGRLKASHATLLRRASNVAACAHTEIRVARIQAPPNHREGRQRSKSNCKLRCCITP